MRPLLLRASTRHLQIALFIGGLVVVEYREMMQSVAGKLLVASPILEDPNFVRTVVLICVHDEHGAFGLVLNRPLDATVEQYLPDWSGPLAEPALIFNGGPVDASVAFALGYVRQAAGGPWSQAVLPGVGLVDLERIAEAVDQGVEYVRVFSGYAGWVAGQLDSELASEGWFVVDATPGDVFTVSPAQVWREVLRRQPGELGMFAFFPRDPGLN